MKLLDLDPSFVVPTENGHCEVATLSVAQGVLFQCPKCAEGKDRGEEDGRRFIVGAHYILCWFGGVPAGVAPGPGRWSPSGTSLADLTLSPSVHLTGEGCGWHGWVTRGEAA